MEKSVRNIFLDLGHEKGYKLLNEKKIVRHDGDTQFIGASIMGNMHLLEESYKFKYIIVQRVFSANRLDDIGKFPLATPFEVMLSVFQYGDKSVEESIDFILNFLNIVLECDNNRFIYLLPSIDCVKNHLSTKKIDSKNLINWKNKIPLNLGKSGYRGQYLKIFYPYRHGIIPVGTVGFIEKEGNYFIDSALFLERLSFVKNGKLTWFEDYYFYNIYDYLNNLDIFEKRRIFINGL